MGMDAQVKGLLEALAGSGLKSFEQMSIAELRGAMETFTGLQKPPEEVAKVTDVKIPGPGGELPARIYTPKGATSAPIIVYYHGGGWVGGNLVVVDEPCRALANRTGMVVVAATYRLAPEHTFPAAPEDAYAALLWAAANGGKYGGDTKRIAVMGDSAGGNLAAVVALMARDRSGPKVSAQVLTYPVTDATGKYPSLSENAEGYLLHTAAMKFFWDHYVPDASQRTNPYASPLLASNHKGLPPAFVITVEYDPLRDEGEAYAAKLKAAGVPVTAQRYNGLVHGVYWMSGAVARSDELLAGITKFLKSTMAESAQAHA